MTSDLDMRVDLNGLFSARATPHVVGMVHVLPLPGSPRWGHSMDAVVSRACADAEALATGGVDGVMIENYSDAPFFADSVPAETIAALTRVATEVARTLSIPFGVNVLRNDGMAAIAVAVATGARFVRVNVLSGTMATDQGWIRGRAAEISRLRRELGSKVAVFADVFVKHATPPPGLEITEAALDTWHRGGADALIASGSGTGRETALRDLEAVKGAVPDAPVWVGSGATVATAPRLAEVTDGIIVGSGIQKDGEAGREIDPTRLARFLSALRG